jgi:hypothetical protein
MRPVFVKPRCTMIFMAIAHAVIDAPDGTRYERGDEVDESKFDAHDDELQELRDGGSIRDEEYDESADRVGPPAVVEIEGVRYVQADDAGKGEADGQRS